MRLGAWNVRRIYGAGSLRAVEEGIVKYKSDSTVVQEVRWDGVDIAPAANIQFSMERGMNIMKYVQDYVSFEVFTAMTMKKVVFWV